MIQISPSIHIRENELRFDYVRASGPGGQNVNKVATAAQLRFDVCFVVARRSQVAFDSSCGKASHTDEGILLIEAKQFRAQEQNREDAIQRLIALVKKALVKPKPRKKTKPTKAAKEKRLESKKRRGEVKKRRRDKSLLS
jgi:ribosome-associated protein